MQELEKILEEMKRIKDGNRKEKLYAKYPPNSKDQEALNAYSQGYEDGTDNLYNVAVEIIRKHMNDGWIPVEERLPENNKLVLVWARSTARGADEWSLGSCDKGFWALGSYGGSLVFPSQLEAVAWRPLPEPYRSANKTEASDWRQDMLRKFDRRD